MKERELLEFLAKSLVDKPDRVEVSEVQGERSLILELKVDQSDIGKVIGKKGRIANAIRTIVKAAAVKQGKRIIVEILP